MLLHKTLAKIIFPGYRNLVWQLPRKQKTVYLTFDDGPYPKAITPILDVLSEYSARAIFFLSGEMIQKYQKDLCQLDLNQHKLGNHGFYHIPLLFSSVKKICQEISHTDKLIYNNFGISTNLFRPPFGIFGPGLLRSMEVLRKDLILWSLMCNDFKWSPDRIKNHLEENLQSGDIVVFHISQKSYRTTLKVLPDFLLYCQNNGYQFKTF